jgi:hypothetical protein
MNTDCCSGCYYCFQKGECRMRVGHKVYCSLCSSQLDRQGQPKRNPIEKMISSLVTFLTKYTK